MHQKVRRITSFILLIFTLTLSSCKEPMISNVLSEQTQFNEYLDEVFRDMASTDTLTLNYTIRDPSLYQVTVPSPTFGQYSIEAIQNTYKKESKYLKQLSTYRYDHLTKDQQLSYDIIKDTFQLDLKYSDYLLYDEILGPTTGIHAQLPILLAEYNFNSIYDLEDYFKLLMDLPRYFNQIATFEQKKSKAGLFMLNGIAYDVIEQCNSFIDNPDENFLITYLEDKILDLPFLDSNQKSDYIKKNEQCVKDYVIPAYQNLIQKLTSLLNTGTNSSGLSAYEHGKEYYRYLVCHETGSYRTIPELVKLIEDNLASCMIDIATYLQMDPDTMNNIESYQYIKTNPNEILPYLKSKINKDFPELPDVNCTIKYVHKSLQEYLSPAMYLIPQLDNYKDNSIYINAKPDYDQSELFTTIAHEGYPGHLYQCVYFRSKDIHPIRNIITNLGYEEGWATYAEVYSYQIAGLDSSVAAILQDNLIATLCIYSRADIGIHYENWSYDMVEAYISKYFSKEVCPVIYDTLLEEPGLYLPYCIGYLEIENLKMEAQKALGKDFNLKEFHEALLNLGPADFRIIEVRMNEWIREQKKR